MVGLLTAHFSSQNIVNTAKQCVANALANAIKRLSTSSPPLSYTDEDEKVCKVNKQITVSSKELEIPLVSQQSTDCQLWGNTFLNGWSAQRVDPGCRCTG